MLMHKKLMVLGLVAASLLTAGSDVVAVMTLTRSPNIEITAANAVQIATDALVVAQGAQGAAQQLYTSDSNAANSVGNYDAARGLYTDTRAHLAIDLPAQSSRVNNALLDAQNALKVVAVNSANATTINAKITSILAIKAAMVTLTQNFNALDARASGLCDQYAPAGRD